MTPRVGPPETGRDEAGPIRIRVRYELAEELMARYRVAGRVEKGVRLLRLGGQFV